MSIIRWIQLHTAGWEFFIISVPLLAAVSVIAQERDRAALVPYMAAAIYLGVCGWVYVHMGMGRFLSFDYPRWASMLMTTFIASAVPLAVTYALVVWGQHRKLPSRVRFAGGVVGGLVTIPLVGIVSGMMYRVFAPWFGPMGS